MQGRLLLNVIIGQSSAVLQLLSGEDQSLLVRRDPLLILDLGLHVIDGVGALNLQRNSFPRQGLDKDLHTASQTQHEMQGGLLLDVVIRQSPAVLQLLPGEDQPLLVRRDPLLVLDLGLNIVDGVGTLDLESDGLPRQGLHKDLHFARKKEKIEENLGFRKGTN